MALLGARSYYGAAFRLGRVRGRTAPGTFALSTILFPSDPNRPTREQAARRCKSGVQYPTRVQVPTKCYPTRLSQHKA